MPILYVFWAMVRLLVFVLTYFSLQFQTKMEDFKDDKVKEVKMEDEYDFQPSTSLYENEQDDNAAR
jgi:hypothetical protein